MWIWGVWLAILLTLLAGFWGEALRPGDPAAHPALLLSELAQPTLIVFAQPRCQCTGATIAEVSRLRARYPDLVLKFYFQTPADQGWPRLQETRLWQDAARIPGSELSEDRGGKQALAWGVHTSGQAFLYDRHGRLAFAGGVTSARGHQGDNEGIAAVSALLQQHRPAHERTPVFGCGLSIGGPQ